LSQENESSSERSIKDGWYVIALAESLARGPIQRWIFDEPVVLYRGADGVATALFDMCPHRNAPLSLGKVVADGIQCGYHGFRFNSAGRCVAIPNQASAPAKALSVRAYPVTERYGLIWIWPGDPARAAATPVLDWPYYSDPGYRSLHVELTVNAPLHMLVDNLMDLTHVHFVHKFGANLLVHNSSPMRVWTEETAVHFTRELEEARFLSDTGAPPVAQSYMEVGASFRPPGIVTTTAVPKSRATGKVVEGPQRMFIHGLTPESHDRVRYIALRSWNIHHSADEVAAAIREDTEALQEDKEIVEKTYRHRLTLGELARERLVSIDEAAVRARRLLESFQRP
jgi:phenylpropionate dioxygenase-like ring-hydroxylating dioxygenase large terminal subunit